MYIHVAKNGKDSGDGSKEHPFATIGKAQEYVRKHTTRMSSDIIVVIHEGTYFQESPIIFTPQDSGHNGYRVIYKANDPAKPTVISGGKVLKNWTLFDKTKNIWQTTIQDITVRQLYTNGRPAQKATLALPPSDITRSDVGYIIKDKVAKEWGDTRDMEFAYSGVYPWSEALIGVLSITQKDDGTFITMKQPAFSWAQKLYKSTMPDTKEWDGVDQSAGLERPTAIGNHLAFLKEPGSFVFKSDPSGVHTVYYIPRQGEDMTTVETIVPTLEALIIGRGNLREPIANITFKGLTFSHATWLRASSPEGYIHYHGNSYYDGGRVQSFEWAEGARVTIPVQYKIAPSVITWEYAQNMEFLQNNFTCIGNSAMAFSVGSSNNVIRGNVFGEIAGAGLSIGIGTDTHVPGAVKTADNRIEENHVHHIGTEYHGSPAILVVKTQNTIIAHNQVNDVPHAGIVVYGGGKTKGLQISHNLVFNTLQVLADGGGIYVSTDQGKSAETGATIFRNVVHDTITPYNFAIYTDYGAAWTTIAENIIYRSDNPVAIQTAPPLVNVTVRDNFWDSVPYGANNVPDGVILSNNTLFRKDQFKSKMRLDSKMREIVENAGLSSHKV